VWALRIACSQQWPGVLDECVNAIMQLRPDHTVSRLRRPGCTMVTARWKHWICLFPQHGPGKKHNRPIVLEPWQEELVEQHTGRFLRGLFHSDGCRITNWAPRTVGGTTTRYEYPRYFFSNKSHHVLDLCAMSLDRLGIVHRRPRADTISVARRAAVAALDEVVGPKS
jgi:hypothetical protein